jgi:hypothetical protein
MKRQYTLREANKALLLVRSIAHELVERRAVLRSLRRDRHLLAEAATPEGVETGLAELDIRMAEQNAAISQCCRELEGLGMNVLRTTPLTVHIPGNSSSGPVVFCWEEGETKVCYGHAKGEEEDQRRPLRLKA